ncbi:MAG TPA: hypothetical protein VM370_09195 [Candidatus Thermoplasmatota archaeon]|nr:hypothetical protein [Candidatus Thermoplasmatota archaeon]
MASSDDILVERAVKDFEDGLAHTRANIKAKHGLIVGTTLDGLIMGAVTTLGMRSRMRQDAKDLVAIAHRVAKGEDARALAAQHLDHILRLKSKMHLIAREDDPDFQAIRTMALDLFARRLPDLAAMVSVKDPASYEDLVRKAFPDRGHVDAIVADNAQAVEAIITHLEKHPHVLRAPAALAPKIAANARDMIAWKLSEVRRGVDEIYSQPSPPAKAEGSG